MRQIQGRLQGQILLCKETLLHTLTVQTADQAISQGFLKEHAEFTVSGEMPQLREVFSLATWLRRWKWKRSDGLLVVKELHEFLEGLVLHAANLAKPSCVAVRTPSALPK